MNLIWNLGNDDQEMEISTDYVGPESELHSGAGEQVSGAGEQVHMTGE